MDTMLGYCGIDCLQCPAYKATVEDDDALRDQTANDWGQMFDTNLQTEDINCLGCKSDVLFKYCSTCDIKECSGGKKLENCAHCPDYLCERLGQFLDPIPHVKEVLDKLRQSL